MITKKLTTASFAIATPAHTEETASPGDVYVNNGLPALVKKIRLNVVVKPDATYIPCGLNIHCAVKMVIDDVNEIYLDSFNPEIEINLQITKITSFTHYVSANGINATTDTINVDQIISALIE
jgi:kynureninase